MLSVTYGFSCESSFFFLHVACEDIKRKVEKAVLRPFLTDILFDIFL